MNSDLAQKEYEEIGHYIRHLNDLRSRGMYYTMLIFGALLTVGAAVLSAKALAVPQKEWIIGAICTFGALSALAPVMSERQMVQHFDMLVWRGRDLEKELAHTGQYTIAWNTFGRSGERFAQRFLFIYFGTALIWIAIGVLTLTCLVGTGGDLSLSPGASG